MSVNIMCKISKKMSTLYFTSRFTCTKKTDWVMHVNFMERKPTLYQRLKGNNKSAYYSFALNGEAIIMKE